MIVLVTPFVSGHPEFCDVELFLQAGKAFSRGEIEDDAMRFEIGPPPKSPWRANGDGRRFVYFAWLGPQGQIVRRIKLFAEDLPSDSETVRVRGVGPDGSPACSRARLILSSS